MDFLVVKEVDGVPSVNATTVEFDQSTGLTITSPSPDVARVTLIDPDTTHRRMTGFLGG